MCQKNYFKDVLVGFTLPKESAGLFKISFFDIIIKPLLKAIERNERVTQNQEVSRYLKKASIVAFKCWIVEEINLPDHIKQMCKDVIEGNVSYDSVKWEEKMIYCAGTRLIGPDHSTGLGEALKNICEPNIVLNMSNAPLHEAEERIRIVLKQTDQTKKNLETNRLAQIVARYMVVNEYMDKYQELKFTSVSSTTRDVIEYYTLKEIIINERFQELKHDLAEDISEVTHRLL